MSTHAVIEKMVVESGIWNGARKETHQFLLTPEIFPLGQTEVSWLRELGPAITECLSGLGRMATISADQDLAKNQTWHMIRRLAQFEVSPVFRELQIARPSAVPHVFRIDVVEGQDGKLYLVEIEATKSHGLGYASLFAKVGQALGGTRCLPGVILSLVKEVKRRSEESELKNLVLLYSDSEKFYLPEFEVLGAQLKIHGVNLVIASEYEVAVKGESLLVRGDPVIDPLLLCLPIFCGSRARNPNREAEKAVALLYKNKIVDCLIPPKPFLGSKSMMALLRNDTKNEEVEAILRSQIDAKALRIVRDSMPETFLVEPNFALPNISMENGYVLKEVVSSGAHGICFSDDPKFEGVLKVALKSKGRFVLQKVVKTRARSLRFFPKGESVENVQSWHTRIGVFYIARELAEVCVTGCRLPPVHGGKDAIFMGTVLE